MVAQPGDYKVTDPTTGNQWSMTAAALAFGYDPVPGGEFESRGEVDARRVLTGRPSERVLSIEGVEAAEAGDWIVTDAEGRMWVVQDDWFQEHYRAVATGNPGEKGER